MLVLKLSNIFNFAYNFFFFFFFFPFQGHLHLNYSTTKSMSNTHRGNTGVLQPMVIDAEGCTMGSYIMLLSWLQQLYCWSCIMYSIYLSVAVAVPYSPVLRSTGASPRITMRVINQGNEELSLYWVNYSGNTRSYGKVKAGGTWAITTYGTHPWLITNPSGQIVGIFVPYTAAKNTDIIIKWCEVNSANKLNKYSVGYSECYIDAFFQVMMILLLSKDWNG